MKRFLYQLVLKLTSSLLSASMRFDLAKRLLQDLILENGADSHVKIRRKLYSKLLRGYPIEYSFEYGRTYGLFNAVKSVEHVEGDIVEFGVGNGRSLFYWACALKFFKMNKTIYGFDSFEGFPAAHEKDLGVRITKLTDKVEGWTHIPGPDYILNFIKYDEGSPNHGMKSLFEDGIPEIKLVKGFFDKTIDQVPAKIALLHLDADLYESTVVPLKKCVPLMSKGGLIIFDEYHVLDRWPGVKNAVDEICVPQGLIPEYDSTLSRYVIRF